MAKRRDEQLQAQLQAGIARMDGAHCRERAAGAVAPHGQTRVVQPQHVARAAQPMHRGPRIVHCVWEPVFGCEPIFECDHRRAAAHRKLAAQAVVRVEVTDREAAAVQVQQHRQGTSRRGMWGIQARPQRRAVGGRNVEVLEASDRRAVQFQHFGGSHIGLARLGHGHGVERWAVDAPHAFQNARHRRRDLAGTHAWALKTASRDPRLGESCDV